MADKNAAIGTRVIHGNQSVDPTTGAVMPPISLSSTYAQRSPGEHLGYEYSRSHNPTRYALERMMASIEGSTLTEQDDASCGGFAYASGLAAMGSICDLLDAGDEVVCMDDLYGGSQRLLRRVRERSQGLRVNFVDLSSNDNLSAITPGTKMVWVETPTNPTMKLCDLSAIAEATRAVAPEALLVCDNTFATPILQRPLEHGFDIVMHSATKYLGGHSDAVAGIAVTGSKELADRLRFVQNAVGAVLGPFDSYMVLRGIKTLAIRMERHSRSAMQIARFLDSHPGVERVAYPGLESHPQYALAARQMDGGRGHFGGMITFWLKGGLEQARTFLESVRVFTLAESLGGVESLVEHPAIMTHASVPAEERAKLGIDDSLIRLSVGIEDEEDLLGDIRSALAASVG